MTWVLIQPFTHGDLNYESSINREVSKTVLALIAAAIRE
jgi:hypothetical protein